VYPEKNTECDVNNFTGLLENASKFCVVCQAAVYCTCFMTTIHLLLEYPSSCHDEVFCFGVFCNWNGKEGVDVVAIQKEPSELVALLKKDLVQLASTAQVRVTQRVNNAFRQMTKPMMVRRLDVETFDLMPMFNRQSCRSSREQKIKWELENLQPQQMKCYTAQ